MDSDFLVWALHPPVEVYASLYYRLEVPLAELHKKYGVETMLDKLKNKEDSAQMLLGADIDLFYSSSDEAILDQMRFIKAAKVLKKLDGSYFIPPSLIYDCDDNFDYVHPFNSSYTHYGIRDYPDGNILSPGDSLAYTNAAGVEQVVWEDKVTQYSGGIFDIARNLKTMASRYAILHTVDGVTVTVPALASYIKDVVRQPNVYVFPNTIVPEDYQSFDLVPKTDGLVRILWQGGSSHYIDWYPLRDAIKEVVQKYPNIKIVLFGEKFDWITDVIPEEKLELVSWIDYRAYKLRRALFQVDINLCPLADNPFNRCKSAIKWYEGSVWDKPEATLATNVSPYKDEMVDNETGLLYNTPEEFVQKLGLLIEDAQLRARLGAAAKKWVLQNRTPEATIPGLFDFYLDCRARKQREILMK